jgi:hypothetical protein
LNTKTSRFQSSWTSGISDDQVLPFLLSQERAAPYGLSADGLWHSLGNDAIGGLFFPLEESVVVAND